MSDYKLRPYQLEAIEELRALIRQGKRRLILQMATGGGKTLVAAHMIQNCLSMNKRALFIAPARQLVNQCSRKLWSFNTPHGILMAGEDEYHASTVQVASRDTLISRAIKRMKYELPEGDLVFIDECHSLSKYMLRLIDSYPEAVIVGLTATPTLANGKGLGHKYQGMVQAVKMAKLIEEGFLCPMDTYAPFIPNMKGVKVQNGEFNAAQTKERVDKPTIIGDLVQHWRELADNRPTFAYGVDVAHSLHIRDTFRQAGIAAEHIDANTPDDERQEAFDRFERGLIKVISNVDVLTQGIDLPFASVVQDCAPTHSIRKFKQRAGRIMRVSPSPEDIESGKSLVCPMGCGEFSKTKECPKCGYTKKNCVYLDHGGNAIRLGAPDTDIEWSLEGKESIDKQIIRKMKEGKIPTPIVCPKCHAVFTGRSQCPQCGWVMTSRALAKQTSNGKLRKFSGPGENGATTTEAAGREFKRFCAIAANRGLTAGAAAAMFRRKFGKPPWQMGLQNLPAFDQWKQPASVVFPQYL